MDPQVTWNDMHAALADRDWDRVTELAEGLLDWIKRRGFPPVTSDHPGLKPSWHRDVTYVVCHLALGSVPKARRKRSHRSK